MKESEALAIAIKHLQDNSVAIGQRRLAYFEAGNERVREELKVGYKSGDADDYWVFTFDYEGAKDPDDLLDQSETVAVKVNDRTKKARTEVSL